MAIKKKLPAKKAVVKKKATKKLSTLDLIVKQGKEDPRVWGNQLPGHPVNHFLSKGTANIWVRDFNNTSTPIPKNSFMQPENFDKQIFLDLLNLPEVKGLRVYFALNKNKKVRLLFVGVGEKEEDIYIKAKALKGNTKVKGMARAAITQTDSGGDGVIDFGQACPSYDTGNDDLLG